MGLNIRALQSFGVPRTDLRWGPVNLFLSLHLFQVMQGWGGGGGVQTTSPSLGSFLKAGTRMRSYFNSMSVMCTFQARGWTSRGYNVVKHCNSSVSQMLLWEQIKLCFGPKWKVEKRTGGGGGGGCGSVEGLGIGLITDRSGCSWLLSVPASRQRGSCKRNRICKKKSREKRSQSPQRSIQEIGYKSATRAIALALFLFFSFLFNGDRPVRCVSSNCKALPNFGGALTLLFW